MFNTMNDLFSFVNWANEVMQEKSISQADIARTGYVNNSAVSMLFSLKVKSVGVDMCKAFSAATGIPLVVVFEKAGILPPSNGNLSLKKRQLMELAEKADDETVELAIAMLETAWERKKRK